MKKYKVTPHLPSDGADEYYAFCNEYRDEQTIDVSRLIRYYVISEDQLLMIRLKYPYSSKFLKIAEFNEKI